MRRFSILIVIAVLFLGSAFSVKASLLASQDSQKFLAKQIQQLVEAFSRMTQSFELSRTKSTPLARPQIDKITPTQGEPGTLVTLHGRGFSTTGPNVIYTGYGQVEVTSRNGTTLSFVFDPPYLPNNLAMIKTVDFPDLFFYFYVRNQQGQTLTPAKFNLNL